MIDADEPVVSFVGKGQPGYVALSVQVVPGACRAVRKRKVFVPGG